MYDLLTERRHHAITVEKLREAPITSYLAGPDRGVCLWVVYVGTNIVAYAALLPGSSAYLFDFFVTADRRGMGVGSTLTDAVVAWLTRRGDRPSLVINKPRDALRRLFLRHALSETELRGDDVRMTFDRAESDSDE